MVGALVHLEEFSKDDAHEKSEDEVSAEPSETPEDVAIGCEGLGHPLEDEDDG